MTDKLRGYLQSGILFIGDPVYMAGSLQNKSAEDDPYNPFRDWDVYSASLEGKDANMPFSGSYSPNNEGRGVSVQTNMLSGKYTVERVEDENGKLLQLIIKFQD